MNPHVIFKKEDHLLYIALFCFRVLPRSVDVELPLGATCLLLPLPQLFAVEKKRTSSRASFALITVALFFRNLNNNFKCMRSALTSLQACLNALPAKKIWMTTPLTHVLKFLWWI